MKRKLLSLTLAAVLALSLTACGGGGSDTTTTDSTDAATTEESTDAAETTETADSGEVANADKPLVWFLSLIHILDVIFSKVCCILNIVLLENCQAYP